jgi:cytidine deaminase
MHTYASLDDMSTQDRDLVQTALAAAAHAYAPYSGYAVGAALRTRSGVVYRGCNVENAAYGVVLCAEVGALAAANVDGAGAAVQVIAVTGRLLATAAPRSDAVVTPCGRCRQLIFEASQRAHDDIRVLCCNHDLSRIEITSIAALLPAGFGPASLGMG